jgi:hypothetical protein
MSDFVRTQQQEAVHYESVEMSCTICSTDFKTFVSADDLNDDSFLTDVGFCPKCINMCCECQEMKCDKENNNIKLCAQCFHNHVFDTVDDCMTWIKTAIVENAHNCKYFFLLAIDHLSKPSFILQMLTSAMIIVMI